MKQGLFRQAAIDHQGERLSGDVIISQPISYSLLTVFFAFLTLLAIFFLCSNDYHRKQLVLGYLTPDKGLIAVSAPHGGRIIGVSVEQDETVNQGEVLFKVQVNQTVNGEQLVSEQVLQNLLIQEQVLLRRIELGNRNFEVLSEKNYDKIRSTRLEIQQLLLLLENENSLEQIKHSALERAETLHSQGLISTADYDVVNSAFLGQQNIVQNFKFRISESETIEQNAQREKEAIVLANQSELINLEAELAELQGRRIRLNADNINHILAPVAGKVASVNIRQGQVIAAQQDVISLIPLGSILQAELYVPSRAIGFLEENQVVSIRYEAFPYQKFGVQSARIRDISKTIVLPSETPPNIAFNEPVYRVIASLESQSVKAFGEDMPLRSGMILSGDVILEERSLFEWLLEPLFSIRGKI